MNSIAQAFIQLKKQPALSFVFGVIGTALVLLSLNLPGSSFFLASCLIFLTESSEVLLFKNSRFANVKLRMRMHLVTYILLLVLLLPSGIFLGSAIGFLQSPYDLFLSLSMCFSILTLALYFVLIFLQLLYVDVEKHSLAKALDQIFAKSLKNFPDFVTISMMGAFLVILATYTAGIALVFAIPFLIVTNKYCFEKAIEPHLQLASRSRKPVNEGG